MADSCKTIAVPFIAKRFGEQATFSAVTIAPANLVSAVPYLSLVRWNGPLNNFTYVVNNATTCVNGDVLKLTAIGNTFTVYKNGVQVLQGTDATQEGFSGRRLLQQRRHQLEWIRFEQLLGEQCRVFHHHSAQDTRPRLARLADPDQVVERC